MRKDRKPKKTPRQLGKGSFKAPTSLAYAEVKAMKKIPKATYKSTKQLQDEIEKRETAINLLQDGEVKQKLVRELAQLRTYAEIKHWVAGSQ